LRLGFEAVPRLSARCGDAMGDMEYGKLRYSFRVFYNLSLTASYVSEYLLKNHGTRLPPIEQKTESAITWWRRGIISHLSPKSDVVYATRKKFIMDFLLRFIINLYGRIFNLNEKNYIN